MSAKRAASPGSRPRSRPCSAKRARSKWNGRAGGTTRPSTTRFGSDVGCLRRGRRGCRRRRRRRSRRLAGRGRRREPRAAEPEVDPVGPERRDRAECLRHLQRLVVAEDRRGRADADPLGRARDDAEQRVRGGARDAGVQVVLGQPVPAVAESLGALARGRSSCAAPRPRSPRRRWARGRAPRGARAQPTRRTSSATSVGSGSPRCGAAWRPSYSVRNEPRSWSSGTTWSTNSSRPCGVRCGTRMKPSARVAPARSGRSRSATCVGRADERCRAGDLDDELADATALAPRPAPATSGAIVSGFG